MPLKQISPLYQQKNLIYSSWEKLWLCAHCSCCHRAPSTQCAARTVGFPRRDRTGFVEQRQLDFLGIFSGFVASWANPQICYSSQQAPQAAISNSEAHRVQTQSLKREITNILPRLGCGEWRSNCEDDGDPRHNYPDVSSNVVKII